MKRVKDYQVSVYLGITSQNVRYYDIFDKNRK